MRVVRGSRIKKLELETRGNEKTNKNEKKTKKKTKNRKKRKIMDQKNLSTVFESGESENQESWYQSGGSTSSLSLNSDEKNDLSPDFLHEDHEIEKTAEVEKTTKII